MSFSIEIVSVGGNHYREIETVIKMLNESQKEFIYSTPPARLLKKGIQYKFEKYIKLDFFTWLRSYRNIAKGNRPFIIAITKGEIEHKYFGESEPEEG